MIYKWWMMLNNTSRQACWVEREEEERKNEDQEGEKLFSIFFAIVQRGEEKKQGFSCFSSSSRDGERGRARRSEKIRDRDISFLFLIMHGVD